MAPQSTTLHPTSLDDIDFWNLDLFEHGDPHAAWSLLRAQAPVWWHDRSGGEPFWAVTRMEHARAVFGDAPRYSSQLGGIMPRSAEVLAQPNRAESAGIHPMIHTDPPRHAALRKVVSSRFTPRSIAQLEDAIRGYARQVMAEAADRRDVDFVTDIAHRIPAFVTFWLLDIPEERWERLAELEHRTVTRADPEYAHGGDPAKSAAEASAEIYGYFAELVLARRENLGDDILSEFLRGHINGEPMPWPQVIAEAGLLLAGGLDTTRAAASAGAMLPLLSHPDQLQALLDDRSLLPTAVEEFVRWASPITAEARTVTAATDLGGRHLREGDRVVVFGPSCNRDERVFDEPFRYDTRRSPNRHISFAYGEHFCLGAHLARLILRVEFEELFARFRGVELTGEARRVRSNFVGGLKHLPVRLTPR